MADIFSSEDRSRIMARIKGRNTTPEREVCGLLAKLRYKYQTHDPNLPGRPDIVLARHQKVIFVHGCFWHGHKNCHRASKPKTNRKFWKNKIEGNIKRDASKRRKLNSLGWKSIVVWECSLKNPENVLKRIKRFLNKGNN